MSNLIRKPKKELSKHGAAIILAAIFLILVIIFLMTQNSYVAVSKYVYQHNKIPKTFVGYKIVQVSDVMNDTGSIYGKITKENPDIVVFTGNLSDERGNYNNTVKLINKLSKSTTVLYNFGKYDTNQTAISNELGNSAVCIADNSYVVKAKPVNFNDFANEYIGKQYVKLANEGDEKASAYIEYTKEKLIADADAEIVISGIYQITSNDNPQDRVYDIISLDKDLYQILVTNQPNALKAISITDIDTILAGGSFGKDPFNTGLKSGLINLNGTAIFYSRGIGNSSETGRRFLNYPEIISITLSDGTILDENPLEKFLSHFITDTSTRFDNDGGFTNSTTRYGSYGDY